MHLRKTLLFYLTALVCVVGIPGGIYGLTLPGDAAFVGYFVLFFIFTLLVAFVLEQLIVNLLKTRRYAALFIDLGLLASLFAWWTDKLA